MIIKQAGAVVHNMSAVVVYLAEVNEVTHLEVAQYTIEQFLSDVGGAAGLFMGMSLATVLGTCDFIFLMIYESVQRTLFYKRIRDIESRLTTGSRTGIIGQKRLWYFCKADTLGWYSDCFIVCKKFTNGNFLETKIFRLPALYHTK